MKVATQSHAERLQVVAGNLESQSSFLAQWSWGLRLVIYTEKNVSFFVDNLRIVINM